MFPMTSILLLASGTIEDSDVLDQDLRSIGAGVQVLLVGCGIVLFGAGIAFSFSALGPTDVVGEFDDDSDAVDDLGSDVDDEAAADEQNDANDANDGGEASDQDEGEDETGGEDANGNGTEDDADDGESEVDDQNGDDADADDTDDTEEETIEVSSTGATGVNASEATLHGELTELENVDEVAVYFEWRQDGESAWNATEWTTYSSPGAFNINLSGLSADTEHEFRAVAETDEGAVTTGDTISFATDSGEALEVETHDASDVGNDSAMLHGEITTLGDYDSVDVFFEWREDGVDSWNSTGSQQLNSEATFSENITDLKSDTEYEFRAVVETSAERNETGESRSFRTPGDDNENDNTDENDDDDDDGISIIPGAEVE